MNDRDLENLYSLNLDLFDLWSKMYDVETEPEARDAMNQHLEALDLVLGYLELSIDKKDDLKRTLR